MHGKTILQSSRGPFLILTPVCVYLGAAGAAYNHIPVHWELLPIILLGALCAHISVNLFNEYLDYVSGLDLNTLKTPFSGGSGAIPASPQALQSVLHAAILTLLLTILAGLYLMLKSGPLLLWIGLAGSAVILLYTRVLNRYPLLCHVSPGLGFGLLMTSGTQYALQGFLDPTTLLASCIPFLVCNNLLLLNQYPDLHADQQAGRHHLIIAWGVAAGNCVYGLNTILIVATVLSGIALDLLPDSALIILLSLPLALYALSGAIRHGEALSNKHKYLAANVVMSLVTPLLAGTALLIG